MFKLQHRIPPQRGTRPMKGRCLMVAVSDYVVIDIETTGMSAAASEIIELGAVKVQNGEIVEKFAALVKPRAAISPFITELTGINNAMVRTAPAINAVLPNYLNFIGNALVVGHNVHFDVNFIYDNSLSCLNRPFVNDFIDTMRLSRRLYKDVKGHKLRDLAQRFAVPNSGRAHRALVDVITTYYCYEHMKKAALGDPNLAKRFTGQKLFRAHAQLKFSFG